MYGSVRLHDDFDPEFAELAEPVQDELLALMQAMNSILGALWGWFALAAVLIGAVLGAFGVEFSAGATIGAGAAAGWALAEEVGLGLLIAAAVTETAVVAKSMFDLRFTDRVPKDPIERWRQREDDYEHIATSTFSLAVMGALVVIGAVVGELINSVVGKAKGLFDELTGKPKDAATGDKTDPASRGDATVDPDTTAKPGDFTPEELAQADAELQRRVEDPNNIRDVTDPELADRYDAEVDLGDGRKMRRSRDGTWCRFRNPRLCGRGASADVNRAVNKARVARGRKGVDIDITDDIVAGNKAKPIGEKWRTTRNWEKWCGDKEGRVIEHPDGSYTLVSKEGVSCRFSPEGDPDFSPFLDHPTGVRDANIGKFDPEGRRYRDFKQANEKVGHPEWGDDSPADYTWHHMRDLKTLQLVPRRIHRLFPHSGGIAER